MTWRHLRTFFANSIWARAFLPAVLFGAAAFVGIELTRYGGRIAALWPANGLLLAMLMTQNTKEYFPRLSLAYIANVAANLLTGDTVLIACFLSACNSIEVLSALLLMRAHREDSWRRLDRPATLVAFAFYVCMLSPLVSAGLAAVGLAYLSAADAPSVFALWFMSDVMGLAIVTPTTLMLMRATSIKPVLHINRLPEATALIILFVITLATFAQTRYPALFMIFPPLLFATFRAGFTGASIGVFGVSAIAIACTSAGLGPIVLIPELSPRERLLLLQVFLLVLVMTIFPTASLLAQYRREESKLKRSATTDSLTGLANRTRIEEVMATEWANARRAQSPIAVVMIDVDYFKRYNDTYGHLRGDKCLAAIARILSTVVHRPSDLIARYGGEEFVLILPNTTLVGALTLTDAIHAKLAQEQLEHKASIFGCITVSIGVSSLVPDSDYGSFDLINAADIALYEAKGAGRARTQTTVCTVKALNAGTIRRRVVPLRPR